MIEEAKDLLKETYDLDLAALLSNAIYHDSFNEEELKQLRVFIKNQKQKIKKEVAEPIGKD